MLVLQALMVSVNLASTVALTEIATVTVPPLGSVTGLAGEKKLRRPVVGVVLASSVTGPVNPFTLVKVPVNTPKAVLPPFGTLTVAGAIDHVKSWTTILNVSGAAKVSF